VGANAAPTPLRQAACPLPSEVWQGELATI